VLISHCERMRYRVGILDSPDQALVGQVLEYRAKMDTTRAALYYPWLTIVGPVDEPGGLHASVRVRRHGVYARYDVERGVHKSPAHEVVRLAIGLELSLNKAQQDVLNPRASTVSAPSRAVGARLGCPDDDSDPNGVPGTAATVRLSRTLHRQGHAVGSLRADTERSCGTRYGARSRTSSSRSGATAT